MARGGARLGSGRKSNADIARARELIGKAVPDVKWKEILESLAVLACGSDRAAVEAARLLMGYAFGLPTQLIAGDDTLPPITVSEIRVIQPKGKR